MESKQQKPPVVEILFDNYYYDVTDWVKRHPGGSVINFYTQSGEDASIAIKQFHYRSEAKVKGIMKLFKRRAAEDTIKCSELVSASSQSTERYKTLTDDFMKLYNELLLEGIFIPSILYTILRISELVFLLCLGVYLVPSENIFLKVTGILSMSLYGSRGGFLMHEAGHRSLTGNMKIDKLIQNVISGFTLGLSGSYWTSMHSKHHAMPQRLKHDVDLETMPLIAFNTKVVRNIKHGKSFFIRNQIFLFFGVDTYLIAMFWKFYLHPKHCIRKGNYGELLFMIMHYYLLYHYGFWLYSLAILLGSMHLLGTFMLSHTHLPVTSESKHWVEYGLEHTMNTTGNVFGNWWTGYLNYQIEHHLFPTIPNFRLSKVAPRVKALAAKHNIPYHSVSYIQAAKMSMENLYQVSKQLQMKN